MRAIYITKKYIYIFIPALITAGFLFISIYAGNAQNNTSTTENILKKIDETVLTDICEIICTESSTYIPDADQTITETSSNIILSELFPNPEDERDEFIELYNTGNKTINLLNWNISDKSKTYTIAKEDFATTTTFITPQSFFILPKSITKIALNNTGGETVTLGDQQNTIIDTTTYESSAPEGQSWAYDNTSWQWTTTVTEGSINKITKPQKEQTKGGAFTSPTSTSKNNKQFSYTPNPRDYSIIITELMPNPEGSDIEGEFIEIKNTGSNNIDIDGWIIGDSSERRYTIDSENLISTILKPNTYKTLYRSTTKIALNNSGGDSVKLFTPNNSLIDEITYTDDAQEKTSYARHTDNSWEWTAAPTPDAENIFTSNTVNNSSEISKIENEKIYKNNEEKNKPASEQTIVQNNNSIITPFIQIYFSEILPNPKGSDKEGEWIELFNPNNFSVDLSNWLLDDEENGSHAYKIQNGSTIYPKSYLIIERIKSKIALNNTKDSARLFDREKRLVHKISYEKAKEGQAFAYIINKGWQWTTVPTPDEPNELMIREDNYQADKFENNSHQILEAESSNNTIVPISELRDLSPGEKIKTTGVVTAAPGMFGKTTFYIQSDDNSAGIQIYNYRGNFPPISIGQNIMAIGTLSVSQGETRIKIKQSKDIEIINTTTPPKIEKIFTGEISEDYEGLLISTQGTITDRKGSYLYIDDGSGEIRAYIKKETGIKLPKITKLKTKIRITGIISETRSGYRLLPRSQNDIEITNLLTSKDYENPYVLGASYTPQRIQIPPNTAPIRTTITYLSLTAAAILLSILTLIIKYVWWPRYRSRKYSPFSSAHLIRDTKSYYHY